MPELETPRELPGICSSGEVLLPGNAEFRAHAGGSQHAFLSRGVQPLEDLSSPAPEKQTHALLL